MSTWIVSGATGQVGSYLVESLLEKGHKVIGLIRRNACPNSERYGLLVDLEESNTNFQMEYFDLADACNINELIKKYQPDYFLNTAGMSHVKISFNTPESTLNYNLLGVLRILEAIRNFSPNTRFLQWSSSEQFGISPPPQNEDTKMLPQSPYGIAKLGSYHLVRLYRNAYGLFASNVINFNQESERRTINFVTRKITTSISRIVAGKQSKITLGNLSALRDWGYAKEYAEMAINIILHDKADDFVIATREQHSIRDFLEEAFNLIGLKWEDYVECSDKYLRPAEVPSLLGDPTKLENTFAWRPKTKFKDLVKLMLEHDLLEQGINGIEEAKEIISKWV